MKALHIAVKRTQLNECLSRIICFLRAAGINCQRLLHPTLLIPYLSPWLAGCCLPVTSQPSSSPSPVTAALELSLPDSLSAQCCAKACKLKCRLRELISCLCSIAAWAVCFEGRLADLVATETGNEMSSLNLNLSLHAWMC